MPDQTAKHGPSIHDGTGWVTVDNADLVAAAKGLNGAMSALRQHFTAENAKVLRDSGFEDAAQLIEGASDV